MKETVSPGLNLSLTISKKTEDRAAGLKMILKVANFTTFSHIDWIVRAGKKKVSH